MLSKVLMNYDFGENVDTIEKLDGGNINFTYALTLTGGKKYILQRINEEVFRRPKEVMANFLAVKRAFSDKSPEERALFYPEREAKEKTLDKIALPDIKLTKYGEPFSVSESRVWRVFSFVKSHKNNPCFSAEKVCGKNCGAIFTGSGSGVLVCERSLPCCTEKSVITELTGRAFGSFVRILDDSRIPLYDVIENFHCPKKRMKALFESVKNAPEDRISKCSDLIKKLSSEAEFVETMTNKIERSFKRIVHNDAKTDNILFSERGERVVSSDACGRKTGNTVTIIDLDTTMYGYLAYDFGDGARSACSMTKEDETDLSKVAFSRELFKAYAKGYIGALDGVICQGEKESCVYAPKLIAIELAARFLKDYLDGNKYFSVCYEEQNLVRARCQLALSEDISEKQEDLKNIVLSV